MNFELTKTEQLFRQMIREFAENEVKQIGRASCRERV